MSTSSSSDQLTAAEILRRRLASQQPTIKTCAPSSKIPESSKDDTQNDIDDEIRRLEAELQNDDDDDDNATSSSSSSADDEESNRPLSSGDVGAQVISLSTVKDDRIEKLPNQLLPKTKKRTLKIDNEDDNVPKKKKEKPKQENPKLDGLKAAVKEILDGYKPRSSERLPFYCRVCAKQYNNEEEFFQHKLTDFHKTAVEMERKASFCKLCRKQLTSPAQLQEHLKSRPHKERLQSLRNRQPQKGSAGKRASSSLSR